jgi:acetolactate synthase small subunit
LGTTVWDMAVSVGTGVKKNTVDTRSRRGYNLGMTAVIPVRVPPEMRQWLVLQAKEQDRPLSYVLRQIVKEAMSKPTGQGSALGVNQG